MKSSIRMLLAAVFISHRRVRHQGAHPHRGRVAQHPRPSPGAGAGQPGQHTRWPESQLRRLHPPHPPPRHRRHQPSVDYLIQIDNANFGKYGKLRGPARHRAGRLDRLVAHGLHRRHDVVHRRGNPPRAYLAPHAAEHHQLHHCRRDDRRLPLPGKPHPGLPRHRRADPRLGPRQEDRAFAAASSKGTSPSTCRAASLRGRDSETPAPTPSACRRCAD